MMRKSRAYPYNFTFGDIMNEKAKEFFKRNVHWAFGEDQLRQLADELGVSIDELVCVSGNGDYLLSKDVPKFVELLKGD